MQNHKNNISQHIYAFIDSQNVYLSIKNQGWRIDFERFFLYLKEKYKVERSYIFIGYIEANKHVYNKLKKIGYILVFKPTLIYKNHSTKGNCDAELVLHAMIEYRYFDKAILVSGDGDFFCLAKYLKENNKLGSVIVPDKNKYSALLNQLNTATQKFIVFLEQARNKIEYKKPHK